MPATTTRQIGGVLLRPDAVPFANASLTIFRDPRTAVGQGGAVVVDQVLTTQTGPGGEVSMALLPGKYLGQVRLTDADRYFQFAVPDTSGPFLIGDLLTVTDVSGGVFMTLQDLAILARAWAENPEDDPVLTEPDRFSAFHWSEKSRQYSETFDAVALANAVAISTTQAGIATAAASDAAISRDQAALAALAAGAPLVTSLPALPDATYPVGSVVILQTEPGALVHENIADAWAPIGWLGEMLFDTLDVFLASPVLSPIPAPGTILRLRSSGEAYEALTAGNFAPNTFAAGGTRWRRHADGCSCAGCLPLAHALRSNAGASNPVPIDQIDGVLYGAWSNVLSRSTDGGNTWASVSTISVGAGDLKRIFATSDGEVLVLRNNAVLKSTGWPSPSAWTAVLTAPSGAQYIEWSLDGDGTKFIAADYAIPHTNCRFVSISLDAGATWTQVIDRAATAFFPTQDNQTHWHGVAYDYIADRFWVCAGDLTYKGHYYSDDDGATWSLVPLHSSIIGNFQATTISTTPHGMVLGSDDGGNNGLARILRRVNPADQRLEIIWRWPHREVSIRGFAFKNAYDPISGLTFTSWRTDRAYAPPIITWSDGLSGGLLHEYEGAFSAFDQIRNIAALPDGSLRAWISRAAHDDEVITIPRVPRGDVTPSLDDTGGLRGGRQTGGRAGVAVGPDAVAAQFSVAMGPNANANRTGAMAIGWNSVGGVNGTAVGMTAVTGEQAVALGRDANAASRAVAVGYDAEAAQDTIAIGRMATGTGASSVVIGVGVSSALSSVVAIGAQSKVAQAGVSVGFQAETLSLDSVAIGFNAEAHAERSVSVGKDALVRGNGGIAIGRGASAGTVSSDLGNVVIGDLAATPSGGNVVIGEGANITSGASSVVIGRNATTSQQWCTILGHGASATAQQAVAVGLGASVGHLGAVALGVNTATEISNSVAIGARDLQIMGNATHGIVMRSPDGTRYRARMANGGTWNIVSF